MAATAAVDSVLHGSEEAARLCAWFAGGGAVGGPSSQDVLVEPGGDPSAVVSAGLLAPGAWLFAADAPGSHPEVFQVAIDGGLEHPGDELVVADELCVQILCYCSLPRLSIAGPTVVRIACAEDHAAFLADADRAAYDGVWAAALAHIAVQLADVGTLAAPDRSPDAGRLYVTADGMVRTGVGGSDLARVEDGADAVAAALAAQGGDPALDAAVERSALLTGAALRPWLGRYLQAVEVRRRLGGDTAVSGFGMRFTPGLPTAPVDDPTAPILIEHAGTAYAVGLDGSRLFRLERDAARLLEVYAVLSGDGHATAEAARLFDLSPAQARELHRSLIDRIG
ncbi:daptide biosynthesis RiPP recognition protein [Kitasatospora sp. NPDC093558]|uniref:daptide biosynthesis RiPP recognition protein n=1 Tax=Kitasatospora sp. NPDC093558 TaxID=3155201 RepID=UPI00342332D4